MRRTYKALTWKEFNSFRDVVDSLAFLGRRAQQDLADYKRGFEGVVSYFQPSREEVRTADEALARDVAAWGDAVDGIESTGKHPFRSVPMLNQTPLVLQMLGAKNRPLHVSPHTFRNIIDGEHGLTFDMLKQIPAAMTDPVMIFDSSTGRASGDVVFMLDLKDANGATIVVPVALEATGRNESVINIVKSAYAKETDGRPNNEWFKNQAVKEGNTRYYNKEKLERWQRESGVQFPFGTLRNAHGKNIANYADLVKLREANPTYYQGQQGSHGRTDFLSND